MLKRQPGLLIATNAILIAQPITFLTLLLLKFLYKKNSLIYLHILTSSFQFLNR